MVNIRATTVASVAVLLGTTLTASFAADSDSWGDMAQYTGDSSVSQEQATDAPATSWTASKSSDDNDNDKKSDDDEKSDGDTTDAPSNSWTPAPAGSSENSWTQTPASSWASSGTSDTDNDGDKSDTDTSSTSSGDGNSWTEAPTSESSENSDGDSNNDASKTDSSGDSNEPSESSGDSTQQEPVTSSAGSQASDGETSSTGSQTSGSTTPSTGGGTVPDGTWPTSTGAVQFAEAHVIKAGEVFDGKMQTFDRSDVKCEGQTESGGSTAVFQLEAGATLKNAIIGKNQMEGVHCDDSDCTIDNVWWDDVCEDALSIKGGTASSVSTVTGGGARMADDKVIQHNGYGTVSIDGFYGEDISKLYRSCGTCGDKARKVSVSNVYVVNPDNAIVTVNKNWGDEATLSNIWVKSSDDKVKICQWSQGNADGEPSMLGDGPSPPLCQYSESDVHINGDVSQAGGGSTPSTSSAPTSTDGSDAGQTQPAASVEASGSDDGGDENTTVAPATSSGGSQTSWSQAPATSSESSGNQDGSDDDTTDAPAGSGTTSTQAPATSSDGSQTSQTTPSTTSSGTVPDGTWPTSTGAVQFTEPHIIKAGEVFDGKMQTFDRSDITCTEGEGQKDTAVFLVEAGGTLKNAIIGKNQKEGVHCDDHDCTIDNVWWDDVCEDALSIKGGSASSVTTVTNCGARFAKDKVVQHNGEGTVNIDGFYAEDFGKLYRSCGTCGDIPRIVTVKNVYAVDPQVSVITVNKNYGDQATLSNIWVKTSDGSNDVKVCQWSQGGDTPSNLGDGPSPPLCQYSESDVHINQDVSQAAGSTPTTTPATSSDGSSTSQTPSTEAPPASSESSGNDDGGNDDSTQAPSTGGSQTSWSQAPATSSEGSGDDGSDDNQTEAPATSSGGSQPSDGETSSTGSQSSGGGGSTTPSTGGGTVPNGTWPTSTGAVQFAEAHVIKAGEVFDGKMQTFDRSDVKCEGQTESGGSTAVFQLEAGATLKNAIIGKNQMEGVHCDDSDCTIDNVWWDDVCEDALSIKGGTASSVSTVTGGGARMADDKVIQHNGYGTVSIDGFYGEDISKLYRSCGTCGDKARKVSVSNVYIVNPDNAVVTVNKNWGDEATLSNIWVKSSDDKVKICQWSQGNADGEPSMLGDGPSPPLCQYSESDVHINGDVSQAAGGSTPSTSSAPTSTDGSNAGQTPGTVAPPSSEASGNDDDGSQTSQTQWTQAPSTSSANDNGDDATDVPSKSEDDNQDGGDKNEETTDAPAWTEAPSKSSDGDNKDQETTEAPAESSNGDEKSEDENTDSSSDSDSTQQGAQDDDQSVTQSEVAGEAATWNATVNNAPTAVKAEAATKEATLTSTTPPTALKCNIRRKRD